MSEEEWESILFYTLIHAVIRKVRFYVWGELAGGDKEEFANSVCTRLNCLISIGRMRLYTFPRTLLLRLSFLNIIFLLREFDP